MLEPLRRTVVDLAHSGARLGVGVFETVRVEQGRPCLLAMHLERLARGTAFLGLDEPPAAAELTSVVGPLVQPLHLGVLRLIAVDHWLLLDAGSWSPESGAAARAGLAHTLTRLSSSPGCRFKTISYLDNVLLAREAAARGLFDVVAANERGRLTDGGRTTLFLVRAGTTLTPPEADGALPGVVRRIILEAGLATPSSLSAADAETADAAFLTNALHGVLPLSEIEGRPLDPAHSLVAAARAAWRGAVESS